MPFEVGDDEDRPRIELDLGLGVFEERKPGDSDSESEAEDDEQGADRLGKLMGRDKTTKPAIEEVTTTGTDDK